MLVLSIVILVFYSIISLSFKRSSLKTRPIDGIVKFCLKLIGLAKKSEEGAILLQKIIELKAGQGKINCHNLPAYKGFDEKLLSLLKARSELGGKTQRQFNFILKFLELDLEAERDCESVKAQAVAQFIIIGLLICFFDIYATQLLLKTSSYLFIALFFVYTFCLILMNSLVTKLFKIKFQNHEKIFDICLNLLVFSHCQLPVGEVVQRSKISSCVKHEWKEDSLQKIYQWVLELIENWKQRGGDFSTDIECVIEQILSLNKLRLKKFLKIQEGIYSIALIFITLPSFFIIVGILINSHLAGSNQL